MLTAGFICAPDCCPHGERIKQIAVEAITAAAKARFDPAVLNIEYKDAPG